MNSVQFFPLFMVVLGAFAMLIANIIRSENLLMFAIASLFWGAVQSVAHHFFPAVF